MDPHKTSARIPAEHLLLRRIIRKFHDRAQAEWHGPISRSEVGRCFLRSWHRGSLPPVEFQHRILPLWLSRGWAKAHPRRGMAPTYFFRPPTLLEIGARIKQVETAHDALLRKYDSPTEAEHKCPEVHGVLVRLRGELAGLALERRIQLDEQPDARLVPAKPRPAWLAEETQD